VALYWLKDLSVGGLPVLNEDAATVIGLGKKALAKDLAPQPGPAALPTAIAMITALLFSIPVAWIYTLTHRKKGWKQGTVQSMVIMPVVIAGIVVLLKYSLALAFGMAAIVAAVRFKSVLNDTRDSAFMLCGIGMGLSAGVVPEVAGVLSFVFSAIVVTMWYVDFGRAPAALEGKLAEATLERALEHASRTGTFVARMDDEVFKSLAPDQLEAIADRAWRRRKRNAPDLAEADDGRTVTHEDYSALLRLRTSSPDQLRDAIEGEFASLFKRYAARRGRDAPRAARAALSRLRAAAFAGLAAAAIVLAAPCAGAQRLFRTDSALTVTISTNLGPLLKERDSLELAKHPAVFSYTGDDGRQVDVTVRLRARGHFRRQARNCDFPPLWLEVKSSDAKTTVLGGLNKLKITTTCRPKSAEYEQYILQEYAVYRAYAALTGTSFRTRLLRVTYRDSAGKIAPVTTWAFLIEDVDDVAIRMQSKQLTLTGAHFDDLEREPLALLGMFEYFIGNTDWSIGALHNVALLQDSTARVTPVAFDFDWTGAVNARYAFPDKSLPIHSVTDRLYRGKCMTPDELRSTLDRFRARRAEIDATVASFPQLAPDRAKQMQRFYDDFWKRTADPRGLEKELATDCLKGGN
jgi:hypothetical protein